MSENRFTSLEEKIAYQEDMIKALNDVLYQQQVRIDRVESLCNQLLERLRSGLESGMNEAENERPPHY